MKCCPAFLLFAKERYFAMLTIPAKIEYKKGTYGTAKYRLFPFGFDKSIAESYYSSFLCACSLILSKVC